MQGQVHIIPVLLVLVGGAAIIWLSLVMRRAFRYLTREQRSIYCPVHDKVYHAEVVRDREHEEWTGVLECEHFKPATHVTCAKACIAEMNRKEQLVHVGAH